MQGGKQYHFSLERSQPPQYWVLQEIDQRTMAILETWAFVGVQVFKCNTVYDLIQTRLVSGPPAWNIRRHPDQAANRQLNVTEHISTSMQMLESAAPLPSIRELKFWQSAPVQLPGQEDSAGLPVETVPTAAPPDGSVQDGQLPAQPAVRAEKAKKSQTKRPPDMSLLWAVRTMQNALPEIIGQVPTSEPTVKSKEADKADRLTSLGMVPTAGKARGAKRGQEETGRDPAKQARFAA